MVEEKQNFHTTTMQKEQIIQILKQKKCRITQQRLMLLDIILEQDFTCCKEIYYQAVKRDKGIGTATVYRMISTLEEIGAISRKNMYKINCNSDCAREECDHNNVCTIQLDDESRVHLSAKSWNQVIEQGLRQCGYLTDQSIKSVEVRPCGCNHEIIR